MSDTSKEAIHRVCMDLRRDDKLYQRSQAADLIEAITFQRDAATERAEKAEAERDAQAAAHTYMLNRVAALERACREADACLKIMGYMATDKVRVQIAAALSAPPAMSQAAADVLASKDAAE
jgi:hypothetical protein